MSQRVNLNDNVKETFPFSVGGFDFDLRYPTLEEIEPFQKIVADREQAEKSGDTETVDRLTNEMLDALYGFIVYAGPASDNPPLIKDVLKKQNMKVIQAFNKMMIDELSA